jgi:hypothetical protein
VTKRQKKNRILEIQEELLTRMRKRFPRVELLSTEEWPTGTVVIRIYAPYSDKMALMESVVDRTVELLVNEGLNISILPLSEKPCRRAA